MNNTEPNPFASPQATLEKPQETTAPLSWLNLLSPKGRIGRMRYFAYNILFLSLASLITRYWLHRPIYTERLVSYISPTAIFACICITLTAKRLRDCSINPWWSLLMGFPFLVHISRKVNETLFFTLDPLNPNLLSHWKWVWTYPPFMLVFLALALIPGTLDNNRFGPTPAGNTLSTKLFFTTTIILFVLYILPSMLFSRSLLLF